MPYPRCLVRPLLGGSCALWLAACAGDQPPRPQAMASRDSAGIRIVENLAPDPSVQWAVDPDPLLSIGEMEGAAHEMFTRIQAVATLPDGRIAVLDGGSLELRTYDGEGRFLTRYGGPGDGPGEFRYLMPPLIVRPDGEIGVYDFQPGRLTWLEPDATTLRGTVVPAGVRGLPRSQLRGILGDGTLVVSAMRGGGAPPTSSAQIRDTLRLYTANPDGTIESEAPILTVPGAVRQILITGGPDPATIQSIEMMIVPMSRDARVLMAGDRIHGGEGDRFEIRTVNRTGRLERIVRLTETARPIDGSVRSAFVEHAASASSDPAALGRVYEGIEFPATMAAWDALLEDPEGNLWVRRFIPAHERRPESWIVLGPDGEWRTDVVMPRGFLLMEVGEASVLGVHRDEFDVDRVRRHGLRR